MKMTEDGEAVTSSTVTTSNADLSVPDRLFAQRRKPNLELTNKEWNSIIDKDKSKISTLQEETYFYASTQYIFTSDFSYRFLQFARNLVDKQDVIEFEDVPHVTVKYGLLDENPRLMFNILAPLLAQVKPIELLHTSIFDTEDSDVLVMLVKSDYLELLNKYISANFKCVDTYPVYIPHITLAYLKKGTGKKYLNQHFLQQSFVNPMEFQFCSRSGETMNFSDEVYDVNKNNIRPPFITF